MHDDFYKNPEKYLELAEKRTEKFRPDYDYKSLCHSFEKEVESLREEIEETSKLWKVCEGFIKKHNISEAYCIYSNDNIILGAYDFIEDVCDIVGYEEYEEDKGERKNNLQIR